MHDDHAVTLIYPGKPVPQARVVPGPKGRSFMPEKTRIARGRLRTWLRYHWRNERPFEGPVRLVLVFAMPQPKTWQRWEREAFESGDPAFVYHTAKPDADNLAKFVKDAAKGILWHDDCQVAELVATKVYGTDHDGETRIEISGIAPPRAKRRAEHIARPSAPDLFTSGGHHAG